MSNPNGRKPMNLTGQRFGRLVVISLHHHTYGQYHWNVKCDCGNDYIACTVLLRQGVVKSCGCLKKENRNRLTHGHTSGGKDTRVYKSWLGMMERCYNSNHKRFKDWGGRGITVCDRWVDSFENFLADMGEPPAGNSIDRINNEGNYEPGNCKWSDAIEQANNRRKRVATHPNTCQICGTPFLSIMPWAKNCSDACHNEATIRQNKERL